MLQGLKQIVMNNLGIKIASLILALAVYAHVLSSEDREFDLSVPLRLVGLPEGLTFVGDVPETVPVELVARGLEHWRLRAQPPEVRIDLSEARPGLLQRPVTTEDVVLASGSAASVKSILEPMALALQIEPYVERTLPVEPRVVGRPSPAAARFGEIFVDPDSIWVRGPESLVSPLAAIPTEEVDLSGRNQTVEESVSLLGPEGTEMEVGTVRVRVPIVLVERRTLGPLSVRLPSTLGRDWTTRPESVRVVVEGPVPLLQAMSPTDVVVRAEPRPPLLGEQESVALRLSLSERLEDHVRAVSPEPETVLLVRREP